MAPIVPVFLYAFLSSLNIVISVNTCNIALAVDCLYSRVSGQVDCGVVGPLFISVYILVLSAVLYSQYKVGAYLARHVNSKMLLHFIMIMGIILSVLNVVLIVISECRN